MIATALRQVGAVGLALGIAAAASRAHAADASPWDGDARSSVRLIAGGPGGATLRAGAEILVAGNAVFGNGDPTKNAQELLRAATESALQKV